MGILNITPDSFSDGGELFGAGKLLLDKTIDVASHMIEQGAALLDIGGESSRPGAEPISAAEEIDRVIPVVEALQTSDAIISVDTYRAATARAALAAGADMINDISAGASAEVVDAVAAAGAGYGLMHMQGKPKTMQERPRYENVVAEVAHFLKQAVQRAEYAGVRPEGILIDPGFGFGKTLQHNLAMLSDLASFQALQKPILVGISRKSMLGEITGRSVAERLPASLAAALVAVQHGANILRVHDVGATRDALAVWAALEYSSA